MWQIIVGKYGHSKKECAPDTVNGNASTGIQMCSRERKIPTLKPPHILNCNENLGSLASQNITAAANITGQIMKKPNVSEDFQASVAVMATVSQLLDANKTELIYNNLVSATTSLTKAMEEFSFTAQCCNSVCSIKLKLLYDSVFWYRESTKLEIQENVPGLIGDLSTEVQILFNVLSNNKIEICKAFGLYFCIGVGLSMAVSLCFSVLNFNIIFISGIENQTSRKCSSNTTRCYQQYLPYDAASTTLLTFDMVDPPADSWCPAVAVPLHYFLLAAFLWSALSSALLYLLLLRAMKPLPGHFLISMNKKDSLMKNISTISIVVVLKIAWIIGYLMLIS
ncbi:hypothetical protein IHE44_0005839, partial [Lamprotornis superbus]